jgi:O-acetylhomoserine (thiol)-lyase
VFTEQFGPAAYLSRLRTEGLRQFGVCLAPQNAFYLLQGAETLGLRMDRHIANTKAVLDFLTNHKAVAWVTHPSLPHHPDHELAQRLLPRGAGSMVAFGVKGGRAAGGKFISTVKLCSHLANVGDAKTLVIHPASTTHQQMNAEQLVAAGISEDMVRLSVGIESAEDLLRDMDQALRASQKL